MRLRDRLFLSYGMLWDRRYGRIISYVLEFLIVSLAAAVLMSVLWGIAIMSYEYAQYHIEQEAKKDAARMRFGLENCRLLAARHRKEDWALLILGFCAEAGVAGSVTR